MSRKVLTVDSNKCIGCRICEQWCSLTHHGVINPAKARIKVTRLEESGIDKPVICSQCTKPVCIEVCPEGALSKNPKTGAIKVDKEKCTGCRKCVAACPNGAVSMHPEEEYPLICDLCNGKPKCVEHCPENAIQYVPIEVSERSHKSEAVRESVKGGKCRG